MEDHAEPAGLCASCQHARPIPAHTGVTYILCGLSALDNSYPKYPPLPVLACSGYRGREAVSGVKLGKRES